MLGLNTKRRDTTRSLLLMRFEIGDESDDDDEESGHGEAMPEDGGEVGEEALVTG